MSSEEEKISSKAEEEVQPEPKEERKEEEPVKAMDTEEKDAEEKEESSSPPSSPRKKRDTQAEKLVSSTEPVSGKRQRKSIEPFEPEYTTVSKKCKSLEMLEVEVPEGRGTSLGKIVFLKEAISHNKDTELLGIVHRLVFGSKMKGRLFIPKNQKEADALRNNLYKFSGYYPSAEGVSKEELEKLQSELEVNHFVALTVVVEDASVSSILVIMFNNFLLPF